MKAPASRAKLGIISGTGLAKARMNGLGFIYLIISYVNAPAAETPTKISLPLTASMRVPLILSTLENLARSFLN